MRFSQSFKAGLISTLLLLNACSLISPKDEPITPDGATVYEWQTLADNLRDIKQWHILGKINIRNTEESVTAAINSWEQTGQQFSIDLSSTFFGMGATNISGNPHFIKFHEAGENPLYSDDPEELMHKALGLPLPLTHLINWIKGIPVPNMTADIHFDEQGLPKRMTQDGWTIQYSSYHYDYPLPLPRKIKLSREQTRITLAVKQWTLPSP